ncbi:hypothetical protein [Erythrobacter mangrovi]|uniref:Uncharacterized protein n=1 Tax=Erythrobacter mangrovi TaxID=2739433 RepID=A0A7D3XAM2_9SPHN|nr:hypothetical protein [Erythrobacter mangrovi]QKG71010.1 hypothetical protein HQR01_06280 [Erythrobacter mangrovi]
MALSRRLLRIVPWVVLSLAGAAVAQVEQESQQGTPPDRIDLLLPPEADAPLEDCSAEQEAASISGEIIVCRRRSDGSRYGYDKEGAQSRYARETMNEGDLRTPNVDGPGIFQGPATVGGLCGIGLNPCPPPPAYIIDFSTLPDAPPGSDADRISRGLPPLGREAATAAAERAARAEQLGLPPVDDQAEVSPAGSASPAAEPSG